MLTVRCYPLSRITGSQGGQSGAPAVRAVRLITGVPGSPKVVGTHSEGEDNFGEPRQNLAAGGLGDSQW
jgi:hypothetical protein